MRFFIINADYLKFIEQDYARNSGLENRNFQEQLTHRYDTLFGMSNYYSLNLKKLGHEAIDIIANNSYIQQKWAQENNITFSKDRLQWLPKVRHFFKGNWVEKILLAQIASFKPDFIYNMAMDDLAPKILIKAKKLNGAILIGQHAAPINSYFKDISGYDLILSSLPNYVEKFKTQTRSEYFKLGFAGETVLSRLEDQELKNDIVFIGSVGGPHTEATHVLEKVAEAVPSFKIWGHGMDKIPNDSILHKRYQGKPLFGLEMYQEIKNSKMVINRHVSIAENYANNMRLYETTGIGSLLITDKRKNLSEIFEEEKEVVTYSSVDELISKIKHYLSNEEERKAIAKAGHERTINDHTYLHRMKELLGIIRKNFPS